MSALGGIAGCGGLLVASRMVKGITAGFTAPGGLSIILQEAGQRDQEQALAAQHVGGSASE